MQKLKTFLLLLCLALPATWFIVGAYSTLDGLHPIQIKESQVIGTPKSSTIQASIDGHYLTVTFTQYIGNVMMELDQSSGAMIFCNQVATPDCCQYYLPLTGDYILTFTLANGDEYYGEFSVTD